LTKALPKLQFLGKRDLMNLTEKTETRKRKSLMSKVTVTKNFKLNLLWVVVLILKLMAFGICEKFQEGNPVLWRRTNAPAVIGYNSVSIKINLVSPCSLLPTDGLSTTVAFKLENKCQTHYEELFLNELEKMCPTKDATSVRNKRELFLVLGILLIVAIGSAGVGMASYAVHEVSEVKLTQTEMKQVLDDLEEKVSTNSKNNFILQEELRKMGKTLNTFITDVNQFKEKVIEIQYLISYLTSRLLIGKGVILETKRLWKQKSMDNTFFEFLHFTMPCGTDCPLEYGEPKGCKLNREENSLFMEFAVPEVNGNLTIVEADPFFLMTKEKNQTCKITYHGPQNAMVSPNEDCIHAVDMGKESRGRMYFPHSRMCQTHKSVNNEKEWFGIRTCYPSKEGDETGFVQVKAYDNKLYLYCPGLNFTLGQTRVVACPNKVFTLPLTATFTLNGVAYQGRTMNMVYNEKEDPLLMEKLEWHLTPLIRWDKLNETFPVFTPLDRDHWNHHQGHHLWILTIVVSTGFGFLVLFLAGRKLLGIRRQRRTRRSNKQKQEEMELKPVKKPEAAASSDEESVHG
jgi:hypothetical protein